MDYIRLGNTGLIVSRLAFGAMTFGSGDYCGFKYTVDEKEANLMVSHALEGGINFFDTADAYADGQSEEILGSVLGSRRKEVVLTTKCFYRTSPALLDAGLSYRNILASCEASLKRIHTDYIDLYLLHNYDPNTPFEESARALEDLQRRGMVRYVGFSNLYAYQAAQFLGIQERFNYSPMVCAQVYYSLLGRDIEYEIVPLAKNTDLAIMIWGPLAGGFLTGKYTRENPNGGGGRLSTFNLPPVDRERGYDVVDTLQEIAREHDSTPAQVSIAWILSKKYVSSVIVGASKLSQLQSNFKACDLQLSDKALTKLDEITALPDYYPRWMHFGDPVVNEALNNKASVS